MLDELIQQERQRLAEEKARAERGTPTPDQENLDQGLTWGDVLHAGKAAALPTLGNLAGTVGGMATGPFAPLAVPALESLGGMLGEYANQKLGITEPSNAAIAVQGIIPPVFRGAAALRRAIPGSTAGARTLNEIAAPEAHYQLGRFTPDDPTPFFQRAEQSGARIHTGNAVNDIANEYLNLTGSAGEDIYAGTRDYLARLGNKLMAQQERMTPSEFQKELRDLGARTTGAEGKKLNQVEFGALSRVKDSLESALDAAPAGSDLATARHLYQRNRVFDDLQDMTFQADKRLRGQGEQTQFNAAEVLRKLENDETFSRRFRAAFTPEEQGQITDIYNRLNRLPTLPIPQGVSQGGMKLLNDARSGLVVGGISHMLDLPKSVVIPATIAATLARPTIESSKIFTMIMQTHEGRRLLANELRNAEGRPLREILEKVAVAAAGSQPVQDGIRDFSQTTVQPFENER